jgi:hypothetical protein
MERFDGSRYIILTIPTLINIKIEVEYHKKTIDYQSIKSIVTPDDGIICRNKY